MCMVVYDRENYSNGETLHPQPSKSRRVSSKDGKKRMSIPPDG